MHFFLKVSLLVLEKYFTVTLLYAILVELDYTSTNTTAILCY